MIEDSRPPNVDEYINIPFGSDKLVYASTCNYSDGTAHWQLHYSSSIISKWKKGIKIPWTINKKDIENSEGVP